jgi:hypothetical protein
MSVVLYYGGVFVVVAVCVFAAYLLTLVKARSGP